MKRLTFLPITAALVLTACQANVEPELTVQPFIPLSQMDSDPRMADGSLDARRSDSDMSSYRDESADAASAEAATASDAPSSEQTPSDGRSYIVRKGDTLFAIARAEYNDESKWRDIWNANRERVPNKDRLNIGQELILP